MAAQQKQIEITPYDMLGGEPGVRALSARFYAIMSETPEAAPIRAMHDADLAPIIDKLTGFLSGWLGGPRDYFEAPDAPCIMSLHRRLPIGPGERDQWMTCMRRALAETDLDPSMREKLDQAFTRTAEAMRSRN